MLIHIATEVLVIWDTILFVQVWLYSSSSKKERETHKAALMICITIETIMLTKVENDSCVESAVAVVVVAVAVVVELVGVEGAIRD